MQELADLEEALSSMEDFFESMLGQMYREAMDPQSGGLPGPPPVKHEVLRNLPRVHSKEPCGVCGECFKAKAVRLPCGHVFHLEECAEPWLKRHCTCPVCRYELPTDDESYEAGRKERMSRRNLRDSSCEGAADWDTKREIERLQALPYNSEELLSCIECKRGRWSLPAEMEEAEA